MSERRDAGDPGRRAPQDGPASVVVLGGVAMDLAIRDTLLPSPGETVVGGTFSRRPGGRGADEAVAAARALRGSPLEGSVAIVGAVGDDDLGAAAVQALRAEGVRCDGVLVRPGGTTGVALVIEDDAGGSLRAIAQGAGTSVSPAEVETTLARLLGPRSVLLATLDLPEDTVLAASIVASVAGARFHLDPGPAHEVPPALLRRARYLTPGEEALAALVPDLGHRPELAVRALVAVDRMLNVAVLLGPDGVLAIGAEGEARLHPLEAEPVDLAGGDEAFAGVLAASLAEDRPFVEAVSRARTAAALTMARRGVREAFPTRVDLDRAGRAR